MLIIDVIDGDSTKTINIPTDWEDMTLNYWCGIYRIIEKYRKKQDFTKQIEEEKEKTIDGYAESLKKAHLEFVEKRDLINMNKEIFKYVADISDNDIDFVDINKANKVLSAMDVLYKEYKPKGISSFEFEGETYFFPKDHMVDNTFGDYIEATQIEMNIEAMTNGNYDVLPQQMAILCRKAGEEYNDDVIEEKTEKFRTLKMDIVLEFAFFLTKVNQRLADTLAMYSEEIEKAEEAYKEK